MIDVSLAKVKWVHCTDNYCHLTNIIHLQKDITSFVSSTVATHVLVCIRYNTSFSWSRWYDECILAYWSRIPYKWLMVQGIFRTSKNTTLHISATLVIFVHANWSLGRVKCLLHKIYGIRTANNNIARHKAHTIVSWPKINNCYRFILQNWLW